MTTSTKHTELEELICDLLDYASDPGYSHIDYRDTMRKAAALLSEDKVGGEYDRGWKDGYKHGAWASKPQPQAIEAVHNIKEQK